MIKFIKQPKRKKHFIKKELQAGLANFWLNSYAHFIDSLASDWLKSQPFWQDLSQKQRVISYLEFSLMRLTLVHQAIVNLRQLHKKFVMDFHEEKSAARQQSLIIEFCLNLGATNIKGDKKAFNRWFDQQAANERWQKKIQDKEFEATFLLNRIRYYFESIAEHSKIENLLTFWQQFNFENHLFEWLKYTYEPRLQIAGFKCLSESSQLISVNNFTFLSPEVMRYSYRFALDKSLPIELQIEALKLLAVIDIKQAKELIEKRIQTKEYIDNKDEIFFKAAVPELISIYHYYFTPIKDLYETLISDDSDLVRQSCIKALPVMSDSQGFQKYIDCLCNDKSDAVFNLFISQIPYLVFELDSVNLILSCLANQQSPVRIRACLKGLESALAVHKLNADEDNIEASVYQTLSKLSLQKSNELSQYYLIQSREKIWANSQRELSKLLSPLLSRQSLRKIRLSKAQKRALQTEQGKRWLAANNQNGFSLEISNNSLRKGERFGFRLWRLYHEFMHPATDKRQHHTHTIGRIYTEHLYIPSHNLAEVSPTKVPGEPLHIEKEGHWRPFLPLVDQFISCLDQGWPSKPIEIFHVTGITKITPPNNPFKRLYMRIILTFRFSYYAYLRNWQFNDAFSPKRYIDEMRLLGFDVSFSGYQAESNAEADVISEKISTISAANKFFSFSWPTMWITFYSDLQKYFVSIYQNSIQHILVFSAGMVSIFWGSHIWLNHKIKVARAKIPTVIGGWGTRGKSGTERLKAALINSLGLSIVSKTTGCEAMFLYAGRNGTLKEMFLFRPYDKATIWEQAFVTKLSANLGVDVLCWECMGLTPKFIDILQQQWMRDDLVTITNCFPDHEDLQGPAGIDIPQTIAKFISKNSQAWTTEENMLPYLQAESERKKSKLRAVTWLDISCIPVDLLDRFPYQEHPANIALVAAMADEFQIDKCYAIKHMADNVIADIGVLQTFPYATCQGRQLRFINGFSANERYGAISNWNRIRFNHSPADDELRITLINNRADRVPRSKVFAALVANDFSAYKHILIGSNLDGFLLFAEEEWALRLNKRFAEVVNFEHLNSTCRDFIDFLTPYDYQDECYEQCQKLLNQYNSSTSTEKARLLPIEKEIENIKRILTRIFLAKFIIVENYFITGNELNQLIIKNMPTGYKIDILGLQNIKGPGLEFVYQWQQWQFTYQQLTYINDINNFTIESNLAAINDAETINTLELESIKNALPALMVSNRCQTESTQIILKQLNNKLEKYQSVSNESKSTARWLKIITASLEGVLDVFDAIKRGYIARKVLEDLSQQRISFNKAANMLKTINKRQKGGWLK
ncbi:hypothetical protein [Pseudoalteromonas sp.]|uniref:hypothetical protein n=1 Tax=Pseudoalteromonas sp. TaxID=53249 RepID=UPI00356298B1